MDTLTVSVIINTLNRALHLSRLLPSLSRLEGVVIEVIVVNGPSDDGTEAVLERYADYVKVVRCPDANLSASRNLGIAAAAGDLVAFIDDDALPKDVEWLSRFVSFLERSENQSIAAVGGAVLHRDTAQYEFDGGATSDFGLQAFGSVDSELRPDWVAGVPGGNCVYRRQALLEVGGYDEYYVYYLDETDVCWRLKRAGYRIGYVREAAIRHYAVRAKFTPSQQGRRWRRVAQSDAYFAQKNGQGSLLRRVAKTIWLARKKHFWKEIWTGLSWARLSWFEWIGWLLNWLAGVSRGMWDGLTRPRHLAAWISHPEPFKPFSLPKDANPLTIALLSQAIPGHKDYGGIGRYVYDLALGLFERGHNVHIICRDELSLHHEGLGFLVHGVSWNETRPHRIFGDRNVLNRNVGYSMAILAKLRELYRAGLEFDVVHSPNWDTEGLALLRSAVYPVVVVIATPLAQTILNEGWELTDELKLSVALEKWHARHGDVVCSPSKGVWATYENLLGIPREDMRDWRVVNQGIVPSAPTTPIRLPPGRKRLLFVGRCEARKGAHTLLAVLPTLLSEFEDWECHLVGNDTIVMADGKTLKEQFLDKHAGLPWLNRVVFHGSVSEEALRRHYQHCDLFVAPSLYESFGLIYLEAMQYGKAVVGCRVGGIPEVVEDDVDGVLVEPDSPTKLGDALKRLIADGALRDRLGAAGAHKIRTKLNYQTMAVGMEKAYHQAVEQCGEERRQRRQSVWPRRITAERNPDQIKLQGEWPTTVTATGLTCRLGGPGDTITINPGRGSRVTADFFCHNWSGALKITVGQSKIDIVDLYSEQPIVRTVSLLASDTGASENETVRIEILSEKKPASQGYEVWLHEVDVLQAGR